MRLPAFLFVCMIMVFMVFGSGCGNQQPAKKPEPSVKIAVSLADMDRDGNKVIKDVMESRKKEDKVEITWLDAGNDQAKQEQQLEKLAEKKVKVVILQSVNPVTGPDLIRKLVERNIKVVALETLPEDVPVDAYVASDHELTGTLMAQFVIRSARKAAGLSVLPDSADYRTQDMQQQGPDNSSSQGEGKDNNKPSASVPPEAQITGGMPVEVLLISGDPKDSAARQIAAAAKTALKSSAEVQLIEEAAVAGNDTDQIPLLLQRLIHEQGKKIQAVVATDSKLAMIAVDYLKKSGMVDRVLTVGAGADEKASKALESGEHDAEVDTRPDLLGQYSLDAAIELAKEGRWQYSGQTANNSYSVPSRITPVRIVETGNVYLLAQRWNSSDKEKKGQSADQSQGSGPDSSDGSGNNSGGSEKSGQEGSGDQQGSESKGGKKTLLRITTQDGKVMEMQIDGEVKKIEAVGQGQAGEGEQGQENSQKDQSQ